MREECSKCKAHHIRTVAEKGFKYCGVCGHRWIIEGQIPAPNWQSCQPCLNCWGCGYLYNAGIKINCDRCNGTGWI